MLRSEFHKVFPIVSRKHCLVKNIIEKSNDSFPRLPMPNYLSFTPPKFLLPHSLNSKSPIEFFISRGNYNVFEINEALFAFDQPLLGA